VGGFLEDPYEQWPPGAGTCPFGDELQVGYRPREVSEADPEGFGGQPLGEAVEDHVEIVVPRVRGGHTDRSEGRRRAATGRSGLSPALSPPCQPRTAARAAGRAEGLPETSGGADPKTGLQPSRPCAVAAGPARPACTSLLRGRGMDRPGSGGPPAPQCGAIPRAAQPGGPAGERRPTGCVTARWQNLLFGSSPAVCAPCPQVRPLQAGKWVWHVVCYRAWIRRAGRRGPWGETA
jgi:hypothetical protein